VAIRNAQIFAASEEERRTAECLAEVGRLLTETLDVDVVACRIVDSVNSLLGTLASALYRLDPVTGNLRGVARGGYQNLPPIKDVVIPRGAGVAGIAVQERRAVTTTDVLADPRIILSPGIRVEMERLGYRAVLSVPLMIRGQVIGALSTGAVRGRQFTEAETRVAQAFAAQAAIALDNARRYSERDA
jgi:GAF domain-containing protein